jgi:hypothetical protein
VTALTLGCNDRTAHEDLLDVVEVDPVLPVELPRTVAARALDLARGWRW